MAISNAVSLANFTSGDALTVDSANDRVGIASTVPTTTLDVDGTATATTFVGALTGNVTGDVTGDITGDVTGNASTATLATNAQGLTGTPDITVGSITASTASFSGSISVGGTLTYEDVENVDSVGLITARTGIIAMGLGVSVTSGGITGPSVSVTGIVTASEYDGYVMLDTSLF